MKRYKDFIVESKEDSNLWTYDGNFTVYSSMIYKNKFIKDKIPDIITGYFDCSNKELISLEGGPKEVEGDFNCSKNKLTDLKGAPVKINLHFNCLNNELTSLIGGPKRVIGNYYCVFNQLTTLGEVSKNIGGEIFSDLLIEQDFINNGSYKDDYWEDLLKYMIKEKIELKDIKSWPDYMINKYPIIKSTKGLSKFNL